jgi:aquaporin Z
MRVMPIRVVTGKSGLTQFKASFKKNWTHYMQEAIGLAIFMISACFFSALFWGHGKIFQVSFPNEPIKNISNGILMAITALLIFYSPLTAPSGSHINPAVTITFLRLNKMCKYDALFYIVFQFIGGTLAVYIMGAFLGNTLRDCTG